MTEVLRPILKRVTRYQAGNDVVLEKKDVPLLNFPDVTVNITLLHDGKSRAINGYRALIVTPNGKNMLLENEESSQGYEYLQGVVNALGSLGVSLSTINTESQSSALDKVIEKELKAERLRKMALSKLKKAVKFISIF